jgi:hypothetical protein
VLGVLLIVQLVPDSQSAEAPVPGVARERVDAAPGAVSRHSLAATPAAPGRVALILAATGDGTWIAARRSSAAGALLWKGMLDAGELLRLRGQRIWLRVETAANLRPRVNGERVALPERTSTLLVTGAGIRVLDTAPPPSPTPSEAESSSAQPVSTTSPPTSSSSGQRTTDDTPSAPSGGGGGPTPDSPPAGGSGPAPDPRPGQ